MRVWRRPSRVSSKREKVDDDDDDGVIRMWDTFSEKLREHTVLR